MRANMCEVNFRLISVKLFSGILNKSIGELELYQSEIKTLRKNLTSQEKVNQEMLLKNNQAGFTERLFESPILNQVHRRPSRTIGQQ